MYADPHFITTDWNYDFPSLPHWNNRDELCGVEDRFFEIPQSDTLCCLYSIYEVTMCSNLGFLAVLKNKEDPQLVLSSRINFSVKFSASADGNFIFLHPHLFDRATNESQCPLLILDIKKNRFSYIRTPNRCLGYRVIEKKKSLFAIEVDEYQRKNDKALKAFHGKKIRTNWLKWHDLQKLDTLPELIFGK